VRLWPTVAAMLVETVMVRTSAITRVYPYWAVLAAASVTATVSVYVPGVVAVPVMVPDAESVSPVGNGPVVDDHV